ncbi:uridine kinase [Cryptosporangium phraense]|uniref:Uridine kinase n=1 Tax=Cryptosporangium phraense TaxID=2593070 RepID=A0A545AU47_9ACTN|nr:uridine kinase [Cryptosporangium phraense]
MAAQHPGHPLRVGIDGVCGAGKTTFARELRDAVETAGRPAVHVDSDGFHHVRARRYRQGRTSARGYYEDAYDFDGLVARVLEPLGPGGSREYATRIHDLRSDEVVTGETARCPVDAVVLFDATFLQRDGLRACWDEVIYLQSDEAAATARGIARDGLPAEAYATRYLAACRLYLAEQRPAERASIVVEHTDPAAPRITVRRR